MNNDELECHYYSLLETISAITRLQGGVGYWIDWKIPAVSKDLLAQKSNFKSGKR